MHRAAVGSGTGERQLARLRDRVLVLEASERKLRSEVEARKLWERALEGGARRFHDLLSGTETGITCTSEEGIIRIANRAFADLVGGTSGIEVVGRSIFEWIDLERQGALLAFRKYIIENGNGSMVVTFDRQGGGTVDLEAVSTISGNHGPKMILSLWRDVSDRTRLEREASAMRADLARSNQELDQFAMIASHDLKAPLRKIRAFCELAADNIAEGALEDGRANLRHAGEAASVMQRLINDLLGFSRLQSGPLVREPMPLAEIVDAACANLRDVIAASGASVSSRELPVVAVDPAQFVRLFQNLLENAIRYSGGRKPEIVITAERDGAEWMLAVADKGIGIPAAAHERVFDIFVRSVPRGAPGGTGIGLAACRRVVDRHGGNIAIDPSYENGTRVLIRLPVR